MADLGEGPAPPPPPLFWVRKEEMTEGKMTDRASKSRPPHPTPPLAQGLDPPLHSQSHQRFACHGETRLQSCSMFHDAGENRPNTVFNW